MDLLGFRFRRTQPMVEETKQLPLAPLSGRGGWWSVIRESYPGAWQRNDEINVDNVMTYGAVFACVTLIASDIAKLGLRLVQQDGNGIWTETESPAFSPVLRKPNPYQTRIKFIEQWLVSKLVHGNTYVLKSRDQRRIVTGLYVLDPTRVTPLVATDGSVYYEIKRDDLSRQRAEKVTVPASEIIHDTMVALFHPLIGVSPIFASGVAALQGLKIQNNSSKFFENLSRPGGMVTAPGAIDDKTAARLKETWETQFGGDNIGRIAIAGDGLTYVPMTINAHDSQLIEQLKWTGENVCTAFHVPPYMIGIGPPPPYANVEPLLQQYYSQCLQSLLINLETSLDEGLGLGPQFQNTYGTEFDPDDLIWLDTATRTTAAQGGINASVLSPNEARKKYYGLGPVPGGESPLSQQQYWPLDQLAQREAPSIPATPDEREEEPEEEEDELDDVEDEELDMAAFMAALHHKSIEQGLYAA